MPARPFTRTVAAQRVELGRNPVDHLAGRVRFHHVLAVQHVHGRPEEGGVTDQRFVEHDADAVPVGRGGRRLVEHLLRCHVGGRAD
jgi:hypothetical protein